jgi:type III secretory pathway component EscT
LAKSAPTLNALTFGMPVKSAILLIMLLFYIEIAFPHVFEMFQFGINALSELFIP